MKRYVVVIIALFAVVNVQAQGILGKINKAVKKDSSSNVLSTISSRVSGSGGKGGSLSKEEIINGLKEALSVGTNNSTKKLGGVDGFFKDAALKILMPEEAKKAEQTLRGLGMGSLVDKAILSMNRAAEDASGAVANIFLGAIKQMTVTDGLRILQGGDFAATSYLKSTTTISLTEKMRPVIEASLNKVNATTYWKDVFTAYNKVSLKKVNPDLTGYVTTKAMDGIFYEVGLEEQKIRKDPAAQVTDLLKKVFAK
ncbi:MAG: DUF4197 domain-containing protein [Ferruginibacter sp.]|nr:DUF4197 domain-containing protein [Ferruginibacter sp.]